MKHTCTALVIHCMDFRFHSAIRDFLVEQGLKDDVDLVSLAGAIKGLVDQDPASKELIMKQIDISQRLHGISRVMIIQHMDCGAYGGHAAFANESEERSRHATDLQKATLTIHQRFPDLTVTRIIASIAETSAGNPKIGFIEA